MSLDETLERNKQQEQQAQMEQYNIKVDIDQALKHRAVRRLLKHILTIENFPAGCPESANNLFYLKGHLDTMLEIKSMFTVAQLRKISDEAAD